jgi:multidrug transporter EmrE-like cation transporter
MNPSTLILILTTVALSAVAQLALKMGATSPKMAVAMKAGLADSIIAALGTPLIWAGLAIYGFSVALWLWVLARVDLSVAYPFVGVSFLITMAFGAFFLNETMTVPRIAGTLLIAVGCVLVGRSA